MRYLSVCSGIEAASVGWRGLGWSAVGFAEIDPFASAVLERRYRTVPNYSDFTKIDATRLGTVDVLVGGTPCQDFSSAGKRAGIKGRNGRLTLAFTELVDALEAHNGLKYVVWENVEGVLSFKDNAFGHFLGRLLRADGAVTCPTGTGRWPRAGVAAGPGRSLAWRVLDAKHFRLPQRRKRLFVIVGVGAPVERTAGILLEPKGHHGDGGPPGSRRRADPGRVEGGLHDDVDGHVCAPGRQEAREEVWGAIRGVKSEEWRFPTWSFNRRGKVADINPTVLASDGPKTDIGVIQNYVPRRLLAVERERLQGFPDDWTKVRFAGGWASHDQRTRAVGNSIPVPMMTFIGQRIALAEQLAGSEAHSRLDGFSEAGSREPSSPRHVCASRRAQDVPEGCLDFLMPRRLQKVLYALLVKPGQEFTLAELFGVAGQGRGATQEIVSRLVDAGLVLERRTATRRLLRCDPEHPLVGNLRSLLLDARGRRVASARGLA